MAALFSDPFMEAQFSSRQSKTLPYQVPAHTGKGVYVCCNTTSPADSASSSPPSVAVGPVRSAGERHELHSGGVLLRPLLLLALLLPGRPLRARRQPWQPAGAHAHEVQHAVLPLQRGAAQHHPDR